VPTLEHDRYLHSDIEAAVGLVRSEAIARAAGTSLLPTLSEIGL
jgi:hypothetical protein